MDKKEFLWMDGWKDENQLNLAQNRSFLFGDGFFESMRWSENGQCLLWAYHWQRLSKSIEALRFPIPLNWSEELLLELILKNFPKKIKEDLRIKIIFFRTGAGRYTPTNSGFGMYFLFESCEQPWIQQISKIGKSELIRVEKLPYSWIKSTSALPYVIAGIEKTERKLDDLIICNPKGYVVEGSYSSLFWTKGGIIFTTGQSIGGLASCMKGFLLNYWSEAEIEVKEDKVFFEEILESNWIGFGSATGIRIWSSKGKMPESNLFPSQFRHSDSKTSFLRIE